MTPLPVAPDLVPYYWPHVRPFIEAAFAECRGDDSAEIVHADLLSGNQYLWIAWDEDNLSIIAAITTKVIDVPRGRVCLITSCGGKSLNRWVSFMPRIEEYAKAEDCKYIRFEGRKGWAAIFPDYEQPWIVLEKRL